MMPNDVYNAYTKPRRAARIAEGLCIDCDNLTTDGYVRCTACKAREGKLGHANRFAKRHGKKKRCESCRADMADLECSFCGWQPNIDKESNDLFDGMWM